MALVQPLIVHWNGETWRRVDAPNRDVVESDGRAAGGIFLRDVHATAPDDVWAVGGSGDIPVIQHWDGTDWSVVDSPEIRGLVNGTLSAVTATAPDDAWAVGTGGSGVLVLEHWDGARWTAQEFDEVDPRSSSLEDVDALSPNDAWAVGNSWDRPLILHWDGRRWSRSVMPFVPYTRITGVDALGPEDAWAVGTTYADIPGRLPARPLLARWDGTAWNVVPEEALPPLPASAAAHDVVAVAPQDVWVRGSQFDDNGSSRPLVLHFDGEAWTEVPAPDWGPGGSLSALAATEDVQWLVGGAGTHLATPFAARRCARPT